jgi:hypothetical protein
MASGRRIDPIFGKRTPLLFAHRGGKREQPESTLRAFTYAWETVRADVLELDVQVTREDEQFVVWHGPDLDNVVIGSTLPKDRSAAKNEITEFSWAELKGNAWVAPPTPTGPDFSQVERSDEMRLLLLEEVMQRFPDALLNIEMKDDSFRRDHIPRFVEVLDVCCGSPPGPPPSVSPVPMTSGLLNGCPVPPCPTRRLQGLTRGHGESSRRLKREPARPFDCLTTGEPQAIMPLEGGRQ